MLVADGIKLKNLREVRLRMGFNQKRLAEKSKIAQGTISLLETGMTSPSLDTAVKLARALGVSVEELVKEEGCTE